MCIYRIKLYFLLFVGPVKSAFSKRKCSDLAKVSIRHLAQFSILFSNISYARDTEFDGWMK